MKLSASLFAVLLAGAGANAASIVLYDTGWEALPASPAWAAGLVVPQNGWLNFNSSSAHSVVANGTAGAVIGGQAVVTPSGSQFHKFTANPSTTGASLREAYPDLTAALTALPATHKIFKASMDVFVPVSQTGVPALHGIIAGQGVPGVEAVLPWGVMVDPSDLSVNLWLDDAGVAPSDFVTDAFEYDTWFNVSITANYITGQITVDVDGTNIPQLTRTRDLASLDPLTHITLTSWNYYPPGPTLRSVCSDNLRITAEGLPEARPTLTIAPGPPVPEGDPLLWRLSWSAVYFDWVLESTQKLESNPDLTVWTNEGASPTISSGIASWDVTEAPPRSFYRLRQPQP